MGRRGPRAARCGDVLRGGGGFGDPLERDPARVAADVAEGYVTPAAAEAIYGVVLREGPEPAATTGRRAELRAARVRLRVVAGTGLDIQSGRAVRLDAGAAARLDVAPDPVVEFVNPRGAPLRAWVASVSAATRGGGTMLAELAPTALRMLAVADGTEIGVRALHTGVLTT